MAGPRGVLAGVLVLTTLEIVTRTTDSAKRTGQLLTGPTSALERFLNPNTPLLGGASSSSSSPSTSTSSHPLAGQPTGKPYSTPQTKPVAGTPATRDLNP